MSLFDGRTAKARSFPERQVHLACVDALNALSPKGLFFTHIRNESKRSAREGWMAKRMGMVPGSPDLLIVYEGRVIFAEIKAEKGKLSPAQIAVHAAIRAAGAVVLIVRSVDDLLDGLWANGVPMRAAA